MMFLKTFFVLTCSAIATISANNPSSEEEGSKNGFVGFKATQDTPIELIPDKWYPFFFTNSGSYGRPFFQVTLSPLPIITFIYVVDYYCVGDTFTLYAQGPLSYFAAVNSSDTALPTCDTYTTDPYVAANSNAWASVQLLLPPVMGTYNFTIVMRESPFSAGAMLIARDIIL